MVNFNGTISELNSNNSLVENRGYKYGDAIFETLKVINGKILFWEDHYFRLMASLRILRIDIPMSFTMEFLNNEILKTIKANNLLDTTARVRLNVDRGLGGKYLPKEDAKPSFNITIEKLEYSEYHLSNTNYTVDLYKDFFNAKGLLSGLKTNNKIINVIANIYAKENDLDNCLLLNSDKNIIETTNGNIFLVKDNIIKTPPLDDGCLRGIMRKQIVNILSAEKEYQFSETSINPFELQKADELFFTNIIVGIQSITKYRKKTYTNEVAKYLTHKLNTQIKQD